MINQSYYLSFELDANKSKIPPMKTTDYTIVYSTTYHQYKQTIQSKTKLTIFQGLYDTMQRIDKSVISMLGCLHISHHADPFVPWP